MITASRPAPPAIAWARRGRRALEWREHLTPGERRRNLTPLRAYVTRLGKLHLDDDQELAPGEAVRLARWILRIYQAPS